jgi:hypothetical protein
LQSACSLPDVVHTETKTELAHATVFLLVADLPGDDLFGLEKHLAKSIANQFDSDPNYSPIDPAT